MKKDEALIELHKAIHDVTHAHETDDIHIAQAVMISTCGDPDGQFSTLTGGRPEHLAFGISNIITDIVKRMKGEDQEHFILSILEGVKAYGPCTKSESSTQGSRKCPNTKLH